MMNRILLEDDQYLLAKKELSKMSKNELVELILYMEYHISKMEIEADRQEKIKGIYYQYMMQGAKSIGGVTVLKSQM